MQTGQTTKSYTSQQRGISYVVREAAHLYSKHAHGVSERVAAILGEVTTAQTRLRDSYGFEMHNRDVLDLGSGQFLVQLIFFSRHNRAIGIDLDVVPHGFNPSQYAKMLFRNGPRRTIKTVGRKLLGIDRAYRVETLRQLGLKSAPPLDVRQMDACRMTFPDSSFDLVYSYSVFHHLPDPGAALREIVRVLRPGGVVYLSFHLYSSENGSLDPREIRDEKGELIRWPHLRPNYAGQIRSNAYLNRIRLPAWRHLFDEYLPGAVFLPGMSARRGINEDASALVTTGEVGDYSAEELTVHDVTVFWRKPGMSLSDQLSAKSQNESAPPLRADQAIEVSTSRA